LHIFDVQLPFCIEQLLGPIYKQIDENRNAETFSASNFWDKSSYRPGMYFICLYL
jgi:hypothetical protein